jgi:cyclomaltodextrinase
VAVPSWAEHAIWWQVYPLGFLGAEETGPPPGTPVTHRLPALTGWLDYLVELGASGLLLGPVFASATHGYDTVDYFRIDARLGDEADFAELVEQAHRRGVRVVLDGVFNHVGREFPRFEEALREGPGSAPARWFHLYPPSGDGVGEPEYEHFEGHRQLVTLNHTSPEVVDLVVEVMNHWLDRGADGWRLDAAYAVPVAFWAQVLPRVRERHPDAYVVGEVIHGDYVDYVRSGGLDSVTQYELWKAVWSGLNDRNLHELVWTLGRHDAFVAEFAPLTFVGNHDVTRIASKLTDERHLAHAVVILLTVGGTPSIYAGDEQGFRGVKEDRVGGDDAVRQTFPADPDELDPVGKGVLALHRDLIGLRRRHAWLHRAVTRVEHVTNEQLVYTSHLGDDALVVALNVADEPATVPAPGATGVLAGDGRLEEEGGTATVAVPAHGWAVLGCG